MQTVLESIRGGIKPLFQNLWDFFKKAYVFCFIYGLFEGIPVIFSLGLMYLLKTLGVPVDIYTVVTKVALIIGQIIPAAGYAGVIKDDPNVEGSMDVCFSGMIICSISIWYFL